MKISKIKTTKQSHTSDAKTGSGDHYGVGVKNKIGTIRDVYTPGVNPISNKKIGKQPKSMA